MRNAIILARAAGALHLAVISGPEIPIRQQMDRFKGLVITSASHDYAEIQLWTSDAGMTRRKKFKARGVVPDLAVQLGKLDLIGLCEFASNHEVDLAGLGQREDIIAAIVVDLKMRHFTDLAADDDADEGEEDPPEGSGEAKPDDPGLFPPGPPALPLPSSPV